MQPAQNAQPAQSTQREVGRPGGLVLNQDVIARKLVETDAVSNLLAEIFTDGVPTPDPPQGTTGPAEADPENVSEFTRSVESEESNSPPPVAGLDAAHTGLLRELAARRAWTRAEFAALAGTYGVLPDGALDVLNEATIEAVGEPVIEGDNDLTVNDYVLQELFG
jgi:hypothetical protein